VPEAEEGGAEAELQYVEVIEDTEGTQANPADEGFQNYYAIICG
jgi:hypothetical protein